MNRAAHDMLAQLAALTRRLRDVLLEEMAVECRGQSANAVWHAHQERFGRQTGTRGDLAFADSVAQAVTCGCFGWQHIRAEGHVPAAANWLVRQADPLVGDILQLCAITGTTPRHALALAQASDEIARFLCPEHVQAIRRTLPATTCTWDTPVYFYEQFLQAYDPAVRRQRGVFYTPRALVSFVVRSVDQLLRDEFSLAGGIADDSTWRDLQPHARCSRDSVFARSARPFVRVLDPAMGTGAFLLEVVLAARRQFDERMARDHHVACNAAALWNQYVAQNLLPRVWGQELMLPPLVLAQIAMTSLLAATGFDFHRPGKLHLYLANTLQQPHVGDAARDGRREAFTVVVGNPPFSGISDNRLGWIQALLRGHAPVQGGPVANYFQAGGAPLRERKHWLQDDYVKFMRFAHWQIEAAGAGIVALVTNHGYLDNLTFRGMREQLIGTFPRITLIDLQGSKHRGNCGAAGEQDESVFGIGRGVAVSLLRRPLDPTANSLVQHTDLWGLRAKKLAVLERHAASTLELTTVRPQAPYFFLLPKDIAQLTDYQRGHRLCNIMPVSSTAAVTARDGFVVAFTAEELRDRLLQFRNRHISDATIRERFFQNSRSAKYAPGDTRGWRLCEARRRLREEQRWERHIRPCLYRPFDRRHVFWTSWMIDWPRNEVMNHLLRGDNMALVCRRQSPPAAPCDYFWVTDTIAVDGLIRSDNRGSESVYPLFLLEAVPPHPGAAGQPVSCDQHSRGPRRANFDHDFVAYCATRLGLRWTLDPAASAQDTFSPEDLFHYVYALFNAPAYRQRFAECLRVDFPRVFLPVKAQLFRKMAQLGATLVNLHLLRQPCRSLIEPMQVESARLPSGFPKYRDTAVWLDRSRSLRPVEKKIWDFRVGSHQVCRKWLKDRRGRELTGDDIQHYRRILASVAESLRVATQIDQAIRAFGGWETAF